MSIGKLYYSHSTSRAKADFKTIPYHSASIDWKYLEASTMSFTSPVKLYEADRIRYKSDTSDFGGQIYKIKKGFGEEYQYEAISYLRLYHDKVTCSFKNKRSDQILKKVLKLSKNKLSTAGVKKTKVIHSSLKWSKKSIWDIALELAWLEEQAGYKIHVEVNADGTLIFKYKPTQQKGYSFNNVYDYSEEYDSSDIITSATVSHNGQTIANARSSNAMIAKWGYVTEYEDCETVTTSTASNSTGNAGTAGKRDDSQIRKYNISSKIVNQALSIINGGTNDYNNLRALYNWCNNHIGYKYYFNTRNGALGTLNKRSGNCCDNAHLLIALARSVGIRARYCHANNGSMGHVYGEYYVRNGWLTVDTGTRNRNKYWGGHWNGAGGTKRRYDTLPF